MLPNVKDVVVINYMRTIVVLGLFPSVCLMAVWVLDINRAEVLYENDVLYLKVAM